MSESNSNETIQIGYSANDFFYNTAPFFTIDLSKENCKKCINAIEEKGSCDNTKDNLWKTDMSMNCYTRELCNNKQHEKNIFNINNTHGKSNIQLNDTNKEYYYQYIQTINLGIGNIFLLFVIFYKIYNS